MSLAGAGRDRAFPLQSMGLDSVMRQGQSSVKPISKILIGIIVVALLVGLFWFVF